MANQLAMDKSLAINNLRTAGYSEQRIAKPLNVRHLFSSGLNQDTPGLSMRFQALKKLDEIRVSGTELGA